MIIDLCPEAELHDTPPYGGDLDSFLKPLKARKDRFDPDPTLLEVIIRSTVAIPLAIIIMFESSASKEVKTQFLDQLNYCSVDQ
jgi:hypothetical protein